MKISNFPVNEVIHGDCLEMVPLISGGDVGLILTDPPYPDYHTEIYGYKDGLLDILNKFSCRQLIFWTARVDFPLDYTAVHIWNKKNWGTGSMYERIFERNGGKKYRVFSYCRINNRVSANFARDVFTEHPSQKPIALIEELIKKYSRKGDLILDLFLGSGTTAVAAENLGRNWIGIEKELEYVQLANKRIAKERLKRSQLSLGL